MKAIISRYYSRISSGFGAISVSPRIRKSILLSIIGVSFTSGYLGYCLFSPDFNQKRPRELLKKNEYYSVYLNKPILKADFVLFADSPKEAFEKGIDQMKMFFEGENTRLKPFRHTWPIHIQKIKPSLEKYEDSFEKTHDYLWRTPKTSMYTISYPFDASLSITKVGKPWNKYIKIKDGNEEIVAVRPFSGELTDTNIEEHKKVLYESLRNDGIKPNDYRMRIAKLSGDYVMQYFARYELQMLIPWKNFNITDIEVPP